MSGTSFRGNRWSGCYVNSKSALYTTQSQSALESSHFQNKAHIQMEFIGECFLLEAFKLHRVNQVTSAEL